MDDTGCTWITSWLSPELRWVTLMYVDDILAFLGATPKGTAAEYYPSSERLCLHKVRDSLRYTYTQAKEK